MLESTAREPFPDKGFTSNNGVISWGMPSLFKSGERVVKSLVCKPLAVKSSERMSTVAIYGKIEITRGIAPFAPLVKAS